MSNTNTERPAIEVLEDTMKQLIDTTSLAQYWMKRCEAAEMVIRSVPKDYIYKPYYEYWREIANNPPKTKDPINPI